MVKANELRIGNWVIDVNNKCSIKVNALDIHNISNGYLIAYAIPLKVEILEKCGFKKRYAYLDYFYDNNSLITVEGNIFSFYDSHAADPFVELKHLHQLQNLYYALIGTELIYTP